MKSVEAVFLSILIGLFAGCKKVNPDEEKIGQMHNVMIGIARGYRVAEIFPPETGSYEFEDAKSDMWGTYFRIEYVEMNPVLRSAGPDKVHYTDDDLIVEY